MNADERCRWMMREALAAFDREDVDVWVSEEDGAPAFDLTIDETFYIRASVRPDTVLVMVVEKLPDARMEPKVKSHHRKALRTDADFIGWLGVAAGFLRSRQRTPADWPPIIEELARKILQGYLSPAQDAPSNGALWGINLNMRTIRTTENEYRPYTYWALTPEHKVNIWISSGSAQNCIQTVPLALPHLEATMFRIRAYVEGLRDPHKTWPDKWAPTIGQLVRLARDQWPHSAIGFSNNATAATLRVGISDTNVSVCVNVRDLKGYVLTGAGAERILNADLVLPQAEPDPDRETVPSWFSMVAFEASLPARRR